MVWQNTNILGIHIGKLQQDPPVSTDPLTRSHFKVLLISSAQLYSTSPLPIVLLVPEHISHKIAISITFSVSETMLPPTFDDQEICFCRHVCFEQSSLHLPLPPRFPYLLMDFAAIVVEKPAACRSCVAIQTK